jgi:N-acetylneuraminic acid mutarotase
VSGAWASPLFSKLSAEMFEARYEPAAALLPKGKVLIAGGYNETAKYLKSAELFNPATGSFEKLSAELNVQRDEAAYVALPGGKVLIAGGYNETAKSLKSAELFNPETNTFEKLSAEMTVERDGPAAALLPNGKVLIVGGLKQIGTLRTAELYDPGKQTFAKVSGEMMAERYEPAAATLPNGKVLVAGGYNPAEKYVKSAELFNPETNTFEKLEGPTHEMTENRDEVGFTALANGKVLIVGGYNGTKDLKTAELFNPETNTFEKLSTELTEPRTGPPAVLLPGGRVLIVGGYNETGKYLKSAEETSVTPPVAATTSASGVGVSSATLNGTVVDETLSTAYFQYGTSAAYGASTAHQSAGASINPRPVSAIASGLSPGTIYHFRIVAENSGGPSYGADQTFTTAAATTLPKFASTPPPPSVSNATQSHRSWRKGNALARFSRKHKLAPLGTTFSFTLNEQASVSFAFTQQVGGRKVNGKCAAQTKANRHKHACKRTVTRGTLSFTGHAGTNKVSFQGRISHSKQLQAGTYTLIITATNAAGQRSSPKQLTFTIVR